MRLQRIQRPIFALAAAGMTLAWFLQVREWFGFLVYLVLVLVASFMTYRFFRDRAGVVLTLSLFAAALTAKLAASAARNWMVFDLYRGGGDAARYHRAGQEIAGYLGMSGFSVTQDWKLGTTAMEYLTGFIYYVLPVNREGIFLLFSLGAFLGSLFFLLAYRAAFPEREPSLYAGLVLFLPSILFWPSSLGKDAVVYFGLGIVSYGAALLWVRHRLGGIVWLGIGVLPVLMVRPHTAGVLAIAIGASFLVTLFGSGRKRIGPVLIGGIVFAMIGMVVLQNTSDFLFGADMDEVSVADVADFYQRRQLSTFTGGSALGSSIGLTLLAPFYVVVTVLFRPFPWEAHNPAGFVTSMESVFFLYLILRRRKALWANLKGARSNFLLALCLLFTVALMVLQSGMGNLGIIARQRVQFLPFLLMLLA